MPINSFILHLSSNSQPPLIIIMRQNSNSRQTTLLQIFRKMNTKNLTPEEVLALPPNPEQLEMPENGSQDSPACQPASNIKNPKKQSKLISFLFKIDPQLQQQMRNYLIQKKEEFEKRSSPVKVISLYHDILFLKEFKEAEGDIKRNKKQAMEKVLKMLEEVTKFSQVTIKERVEKKLANLQPSQLTAIIASGKDISFNNKKQLNNKYKQPCNNQNPPSAKEPSQGQKTSVHSVGPAPISTKRSLFQKQAETEERQITSIFEKKEAIYEEQQMEAENDKGIERNKKVEEKFTSEMSPQKCSILEPEIQYISAVKQQTQTLLIQMQNKQLSEEQLKIIEQLKIKLSEITQLQRQISLKKEETTKTQSTSSKSIQQGEERTGIKMIQEEEAENEAPEGSIIQEITPADTEFQFKRLMRMLCNNAHYLEIVQENPSKLADYAWNEDEDKLLWSFKFNPNFYRAQMQCLLRYKSIGMIVERMRFTGMELDLKLESQLTQLSPEYSKFARQQLRQSSEAREIMNL